MLEVVFLAPYLWLSMLLGVLLVPLVLFDPTVGFVVGLGGELHMASAAALCYAGYLPIAIAGLFLVTDRHGIPIAYWFLVLFSPRHRGHAVVKKATRSVDAPSFDGDEFFSTTPDQRDDLFGIRHETKELRKMAAQLLEAQAVFNARAQRLAEDETERVRAQEEVARLAEELERAKARVAAYEEREGRRDRR